jgi:membrane protein insertase Oxa1/YidC/SpoIIIJ
MFLPLGFVFFILSGSILFPSGLLIYWVTTNLWTVGQGLVTRQLVPKKTEPAKRSSRTPPRTQEAAPATATAAAAAPSGGPQGPPRRVKRKKKRARR